MQKTNSLLLNILPNQCQKFGNVNNLFLNLNPIAFDKNLDRLDKPVYEQLKKFLKKSGYTECH